jgi:hypothetical protein
VADIDERRMHEGPGLDASRRVAVIVAAAAVVAIALVGLALSTALGTNVAVAVVAVALLTTAFAVWFALDAASSRRRRTAAFAEQRTSDVVTELAPHGWLLVDNVEFDGLDVDHVALGPGGVVVLETKWIDDGLFTADGALSRYGCEALEQARRHTDRIRSVLADGGTDTSVVRTFVVVWGTAVPGGRLDSDDPTGSLIDGRLLAELLRSLDVGFPEVEVELARRTLLDFVDARALRNAAVAESARRHR